MPLTSRPRLVTVAALTAVLVPLLGTGPATADDEPAAGDTVVGELVQAWADPEHADPTADHGTEDAGLLSWIDVADGESVRVPTEDVADLEVGATVEVTLGGDVRDDAVLEQGLAPARDVADVQVVAPAEAAATTVPHTNSVTVVLVRPGGAPQDATTPADVVAVVDGAVRQFWSGQSNGAITVAVVGSHDWIQTAADCSTPAVMWQQAADAVHWAGGPAEHLLLYVPRGTPGCAYGLGSIGSGIGDGGVAYVQDTIPSVIAHELGHNFGLGHSSAKQCNASPETAPCQTDPYADWHDVMGYSWEQIGSLNAVQATSLGVLSAHPMYWFPGSNTVFDLRPLSGTEGWRAIELISERGTRYFVEYRPAAGQDAWLGTSANRPRVDAGVQIRVAAAGDDTSLLLDATPSPSSGWATDRQHAVPVGTTVSLNGGEFRVVVDGVSASSAFVRVLTRAPGSAIDQAHLAAGGDAGPFGAPVTGEVCGLRDGGCYRDYERGSIYWSPATGAQLVNGALRSRWRQLGSENGYLGYPTAAPVCGLRDGGCGQNFQGGTLYWSAGSGAQAVNGAIRSRFASLGYEGGYLGYPVGAAVCGLRDGGCGQVFQGGAVYWSAASGAQAVNGAIRSRHASLGFENGFLGYPVAAPVCGLRDGGCGQNFQGGTLYWSAASGTQPVNGAIRTRWAQLGWENGSLGYPVENAAVLLNGDVSQRFQGGALYWSARTGQVRAY